MMKSLRLTMATALLLFLVGTNESEIEAQEVVTYYPPAASIGYVPVQRGLLGRRISIEPVVAFSPPVVTTAYRPAPVVAYGQPIPVASSSLYAPTVVNAYYAPALYYPPAVYAPAPFYYPAPAPVFVAPVTTTFFYSPW